LALKGRSRSIFTIGERKAGFHTPSPSLRHQGGDMLLAEIDYTTVIRLDSSRESAFYSKQMPMKQTIVE
jgi:hypothetical protein